MSQKTRISFLPCFIEGRGCGGESGFIKGIWCGVAGEGDPRKSNYEKRSPQEVTMPRAPYKLEPASPKGEFRVLLVL